MKFHWWRKNTLIIWLVVILPLPTLLVCRAYKAGIGGLIAALLSLSVVAIILSGDIYAVNGENVTTWNMTKKVVALAGCLVTIIICLLTFLEM